MWISILIAVLYGTVAVAANFVNKYAVQVLPLPATILFIQTLTTVVGLRLLAALQIVRLPSLRALRVQQVAPLAACYCVHAVLVLYSLAFLSVPMYNTLKRLTPVIVLTIKAVADRRWPDAQTTWSVLLIVSGCLVAGAGDLSFDGTGYSLALICAVAQAAYILLAERAGGGGGSGHGSASTAAKRKQHPSETSLPDVESRAPEGRGGTGQGGFGSKQELGSNTSIEVHAYVGSYSSASHGPMSAAELLYSMFCVALPALAVACLATGEGARAPAQLMSLREAMGGPGFVMWASVTAVMEGLLTGSLILCAQLNSALTTSIVGVLKGAVSSVLGFFLLGGVKFHALNVTGIVMNMTGGAWYSARQYFASKR